MQIKNFSQPSIDQNKLVVHQNESGVGGSEPRN